MNRQSFKERYGPWAMVTGGASGIGAEFASQLAGRGINLVLVDIQAGMMEHMNALKTRSGAEIIAIHADLSKSDLLKKIRPVTKNLEIGLLVNNAAWGTAGEFMKSDPEEMLRTVAVNCAAPMILARELGPAMTRRGRGGIIFVSSLSAMQVTPILANYAATKAYNLILAEALWDELRSSGVDVLALCPGATDTPALHKSGACIENVPGMPLGSPAEVVSAALCSLGDKPSVIPGLMNKVAAFVMSRIMTRRQAVVFSGKSTRRLFPGK